MKIHRAFRPRVLEFLEDRAVPSVAGLSAPAGISTPAGVFNLSVTLPPQVRVGSPPVAAAFAAFDASVERSVEVLLLAPGPGGTVDPSANRAAFNRAVVGALDTLAADLVRSLGDTSTSAGSAAASRVVSAIVGDGPGSLENQILALATASIRAVAIPVPVHLTPPTPTPLTTFVDTAEQVRPTLRPPVAPGDVAPPSTVGDLAASPSAGATQGVRSAFGDFLKDYFRAVDGVLLAAGPDGRVAPGAHRADFDAQVDRALERLGGELTATLGRHPAASSMVPKVLRAVEGDGPDSLRSRLGALPTPAGPQAATVRDFTLGSTRAVAGILAMISDDVARLLRPARGR